jgi:hypothetical protein
MNLPPITTLDTDRPWKGESLTESRAWRNRRKTRISDTNVRQENLRRYEIRVGPVLVAEVF